MYSCQIIGIHLAFYYNYLLVFSFHVMENGRPRWMRNHQCLNIIWKQIWSWKQKCRPWLVYTCNWDQSVKSWSLRRKPLLSWRLLSYPFSMSPETSQLLHEKGVPEPSSHLETTNCSKTLLERENKYAPRFQITQGLGSALWVTRCVCQCSQYQKGRMILGILGYWFPVLCKPGPVSFYNYILNFGISACLL